MKIPRWIGVPRNPMDPRPGGPLTEFEIYSTFATDASCDSFESPLKTTFLADLVACLELELDIAIYKESEEADTQEADTEVRCHVTFF